MTDSEFQANMAAVSQMAADSVARLKVEYASKKGRRFIVIHCQGYGQAGRISTKTKVQSGMSQSSWFHMVESGLMIFSCQYPLAEIQVQVLTADELPKDLVGELAVNESVWISRLPAELRRKLGMPVLPVTA